MEYLCVNRFDTTKNLAVQFGVCERTIRQDLVVLACSYPIETSFGPYGGVHLPGWFRYGKKVLSPEQIVLLKKVKNSLNQEDCKIIDSILAQFALPGSY